MKKQLKRAITILLLLVFSFTMLFTPVSAAASAQIQIRTVASENGTYNDKAVFTVGDKIYLAVKFSGIGDTPVQGFSCDITFDNEVLSFSESTFTAIKDDNAYFYKGTEENKVYLIWDSTSANTVFNGDVIFVVFETKQITENKDVNFAIEVKDFYSSGKNKPDIAYNIVNSTIAASVSIEKIDDATLSLLQKLENITLNSLEDIVAAETAWNGLTDRQKQLLSTNHKKEYDWLSTARSRLNELIAQANEAQVNKLLNEFKTTHKTVLGLTKDTVKIENKEAVKAAQTAYKALPTSVTTRLDQTIPARLQELLDQIETLEDADKEAKSFEETYGYLTEITDVMLEESFSMYSGFIDESIMIYDMMSEEAKAAVKETYDKLSALRKKCDDITANNEALAAIRDEVNAFQQKWLKVFTLNAGNVTVYDRTAIQMVLDDYNKSLGEEAKKSLASRITSLSGLLEVIGELESSMDEETEDESEDSGDIQTEIKETVVEKEVKVTNTKYLNKKISKAIWLMFILLAIAVLTLIFPLVMTIRYKRRLAMLGEDNYMEEEE
ncbi:MAG: hypothetical protein J6J39_05170 [Clostridia bacterium]|nr:hypothetical protein [Clostridia bacterium]